MSRTKEGQRMPLNESGSTPVIVLFCHPGTRDAVIESFDSDDLDYDVKVYESPDVPAHLRWVLSVDPADPKAGS